ncbi:MAG TPA: hypothetical protein PKY35_14785 [Candidatus Hydrogenedentes bacterium]|nr:hypothetical protein [Candidatus Hydrogenedentota bacterium]HOL78281.1 hypothetical protein [Candidatus Hydrogenedentota bacterium]HPO87458.1 hypothetical protein [Candidatus Hydrogenedentota bacterium]
MKWLAFTVRFLCLAPVCLVLWWYVLPAYAKILGFFSVVILRFVFLAGIESFRIVPLGLFYTGTLLQFHTDTQEFPFPIGQLTTNMAPFVALMFSTPKIKLRKRILATSIGCMSLFFSHLFYVVFAFQFSRQVNTPPYVSHIIAPVFLTLPFLLWIVLLQKDLIGEKTL